MELYHHGVKGQKRGVRRYQDSHGALTEEGYIHYYGHPRTENDQWKSALGAHLGAEAVYKKKRKRYLDKANSAAGKIKRKSIHNMTEKDYDEKFSRSETIRDAERFVNTITAIRQSSEFQEAIQSSIERISKARNAYENVSKSKDPKLTEKALNKYNTEIRKEGARMASYLYGEMRDTPISHKGGATLVSATKRAVEQWVDMRYDIFI